MVQLRDPWGETLGGRAGEALFPWCLHGRFRFYPKKKKVARFVFHKASFWLPRGEGSVRNFCRVTEGASAGGVPLPPPSTCLLIPGQKDLLILFLLPT